jgi:hypothetical protein
VEYGRGIWSHWQADTPPLVKCTVMPVAVRSTTHSRGLPYHALLASAYAPMASQRSRVRFDISTTHLRGTWTLRMHPCPVRLIHPSLAVRAVVTATDTQTSGLILVFPPIPSRYSPARCAVVPFAGWHDD